MAEGSRFSTSTVVDSENLVPWLSAEEPLAYTPTKPTARDYFFQYTWILSGIFNPQVNLREHRYFGSPLKDSARFLFDFWANARRGDGPALQRYCQFGFFSDNELRTPIAAYHHVRDYRDTPGSLLIQHGSYQWVSLEDQPRIPGRRGLALSGHRTGHSLPLLAIPAQRTLSRERRNMAKMSARSGDMLSDSILSFNTVHDRLKRCETAGLRNGTWVGDELATPAGLDIQSPGFARDLWHARPAVVFAPTSNGSSEVRSPPCRRQDPSEEHPHHDVLFG